MRTRKHRGAERGKTDRGLPRGMRRLTIRGEEWGWRYGNPTTIRAPAGKGYKADLATDGEYAVTPSNVISHIDRHILGYDDALGFPRTSRWHRHQAAVRDGWTAFEGPRGTWQARISAWIIEIRSPEDVASSARAYDVLGMTVAQWCEIKVADMTERGVTIDDLYAQEAAAGPHGVHRDKARILMEYNASSMPAITPVLLTAYVERCVVGRAALILARAA